MIKRYLLVSLINAAFSVLILAISSPVVNLSLGIILLLFCGFLTIFLSSPKAIYVGTATIIRKTDTLKNNIYLLRFDDQREDYVDSVEYSKKYSKELEVGEKVNAGYYQTKDGTKRGMIGNAGQILPGALFQFCCKILTAIGGIATVIGIIRILLK